jgi:hypothetical protein
MPPSQGQSALPELRRDLPIVSKPESSYQPVAGPKSEEAGFSWEPTEIWTSPPTRLPDGSEHPFFKTIKSQPKPDPGSSIASRPGGPEVTAPELPLVYPFIPAPTLFCEPESIDMSPTEANVPEKELESPETSPKAKGQSRVSTPSINDRDSGTAQSTPMQDDPSASAKCRSTYTRRAQSDGYQERVIQGQIWRGRTETDRHWRRHQWVVER